METASDFKSGNFERNCTYFSITLVLVAFWGVFIYFLPIKIKQNCLQTKQFYI